MTEFKSEPYYRLYSVAWFLISLEEVICFYQITEGTLENVGRALMLPLTG